MSTPAQIRRIHALKRDAGLKEDRYRVVLAEVGGVASSVDLDPAGAERVIAALAGLAGPARRPAETATGRYAGKLQSLWISGYNLGVIRDRDDRAMLAWLRDRFGVDHPRFLVDGADAMPAIEGLKSWLARDGGVRWPSSEEPRHQAMAVVDAIAGRLLAQGDSEVGMRPYLYGARHGLPAMQIDHATADLHRLCNLLGARLRLRLAAPAAAAPKRRRGRAA